MQQLINNKTVEKKIQGVSLCSGKLYFKTIYTSRHNGSKPATWTQKTRKSGSSWWFSFTRPHFVITMIWAIPNRKLSTTVYLYLKTNKTNPIISLLVLQHQQFAVGNSRAEVWWGERESVFGPTAHLVWGQQKRVHNLDSCSHSDQTSVKVSSRWKSSHFSERFWC